MLSWATSAPGHHRDMAADQLDLGQEMARQEHGGAFVGQFADEVADLTGALGIHAVGRLVEQQQLAGTQQSVGQPEPLTHAERVRLVPLVGRRRQPDTRQCLGHAGPAGRAAAVGPGGVVRMRFCRPVSHG